MDGRLDTQDVAPRETDDGGPGADLPQAHRRIGDTQLVVALTDMDGQFLAEIGGKVLDEFDAVW